jgi:hypothetical protein
VEYLITTRSANRSYRRKYQKIRHQFKQAMQASNELIREEQRAAALARRLQEQIEYVLTWLYHAVD